MTQSSTEWGTDATAPSATPALTLAEINTLGLLAVHTDAAGETVATLHRDGRELDLDGLGHFMDLVEQSRGPWIEPTSTEEAQAVSAQFWRSTLAQATTLAGDHARAVNSAIESLNTLQASMPALIERLREVVGEHEAKKNSLTLSSLFRGR